MNPEELMVGSTVQCYRKPHHKIMTPHGVKSIFKSDEDGMYYVELEDGFIVNIGTGVVGCLLYHEWLKDRFKYKLTIDPNYPGVETRSYEIKRNVYLLEWYDVKNRKDTYILQIGRVAIDNCHINFLHELQKLYSSVFKEKLPL